MLIVAAWPTEIGQGTEPASANGRVDRLPPHSVVQLLTSLSAQKSESVLKWLTNTECGLCTSRSTRLRG